MNKKNTEKIERNFFKHLAAICKKPATWVFIISMALSFYLGRTMPPTWTSEKIALDIQTEVDGRKYVIEKEAKTYIDNIVPIASATLSKDSLNVLNETKGTPQLQEEFVSEEIVVNGEPQTNYYMFKLKKHWKFWSLMPPLVAILLCWMTREPVAALTCGIIAGALILQKYDLSDQVFLQTMMSKDAAGVLILYLWFLGGLMGIWTRTGAMVAFGEAVTKHLVKGPRSAKLVAWGLSFFFFQGGSISCILTGTTAKPIADRERVSHEELAHIVNANSTAVATTVPLNAWPAYVAAFIYVSGVGFLATEAQRIMFFFKCIPFYFYSIIVIIMSFLFAIEKSPFVNKKMKLAIKRARETGQLDAPDAQPLSAKELQTSNVPKGYKPHIIDFILPLGSLILVALYTMVTMGSPQVRWAFGIALIVAILLAMVRGMTLKVLLEGLMDGFKGIIIGSLILVLAVTIGKISIELGGGAYLVELLGTFIPYWILPVLLVALTMTISLSTGSSWGTYAITFPLAMPLAWMVANTPAVHHPYLFMCVCFAAVINGSIWGDSCSPISDCCVLSSMSTGADLMDHAITQIRQCIVYMAIALVAWTAFVLIFV